MIAPPTTLSRHGGPVRLPPLFLILIQAGGVGTPPYRQRVANLIREYRVPIRDHGLVPLLMPPSINYVGALDAFGSCCRPANILTAIGCMYHQLWTALRIFICLGRYWCSGLPAR